MNKTLVASTLTALCLGAHATDLVTNGSFEANAQASGTWAIYGALTGWTGAPDIELRNNVAGVAQDGVNFVELDTRGNSAMYQDLSGAAGWYDLSFWYSPRPNVAAGSNGIAVSFDGSPLMSVGVGQAGGGAHNWVQYTQHVWFDGSARLQFAAIETSDSYGGSLDHVSFTASVPEPQTYALMLAGIAVIGFISLRRRRD